MPIGQANHLRYPVAGGEGRVEPLHGEDTGTLRSGLRPGGDPVNPSLKFAYDRTPARRRGSRHVLQRRDHGDEARGTLGTADVRAQPWSRPRAGLPGSRTCVRSTLDDEELTRAMFQPNQRVPVDLSGLTVQGVSFSQNVQKVLATVVEQVSIDPSVGSPHSGTNVAAKARTRCATARRARRATG